VDVLEKPLEKKDFVKKVKSVLPENSSDKRFGYKEGE